MTQIPPFGAQSQACGCGLEAGVGAKRHAVLHRQAVSSGTRWSLVCLFPPLLGAAMAQVNPPIVRWRLQGFPLWMKVETLSPYSSEYYEHRAIVTKGDDYLGMQKAEYEGWFSFARS